MSERKMIYLDDAIDVINDLPNCPNGYSNAYDKASIISALEEVPSAQPEHPGKCKWCERLKERNLRIEYYWIDQEGCTASFSEPHVVATGIANFCPNCGADMRGEQDDESRSNSNAQTDTRARGMGATDKSSGI